jgi:hypothetical protein
VLCAALFSIHYSSQPTLAKCVVPGVFHGLELSHTSCVMFRQLCLERL